VVVAAAAVADYMPASFSESKIKKSSGFGSLELSRTPDILAELGSAKGERVLVGFAAETDDLLSNAERKLSSKNLDMIVANMVGGEDSPFGADHNTVTILCQGAPPETFPAMSKLVLAHEILDRISAICHHKESN